MEEPYSTEAYNLPSKIVAAQNRFVAMTYNRASLPNLQPLDPDNSLQFNSKNSVKTTSALQFDTKKVAAKGTLQRMKTKVRSDLQNSLDTDCVEDTDMEHDDTEKLLSTLTESFDMKMRLLLDPNYQSSGVQSSENLFDDVDDNSFRGINKKQLDEAKNVLQQVRAGRKVDLKRGVHVDKQRVREQHVMSAVPRDSGVLRPVNNKRPLDRSNSLTKQEKTELNLKAQEKENLTSCVRDVRSNQRSRVDVTKLRKKLSECKNRRIQRRHTVGGTKDFSDNVVGLLVRGVSVWDRLVPIINDNQDCVKTTFDNQEHQGEDEDIRRYSLQFDDERTLSLPTVESNL